MQLSNLKNLYINLTLLLFLGKGLPDTVSSSSEPIIWMLSSMVIISEVTEEVSESMLFWWGLGDSGSNSSKYRVLLD